MEPIENWQTRYENKDTGWDIGTISNPLRAYFDQLTNKNLKILIPGGGNGYEAAYLHQQGFKNVFLLDIAPKPLADFSTRHPDFPKKHLIAGNFFKHKGNYDLLVEQTFFCAIDPAHRLLYAQQASKLLRTNGKLIGLFWSKPMNLEQPPFGGNKTEYLSYFKPYFNIKTFEQAHNSIKPRMGTELFLIAQVLD